ncbi:MAG: transposase [Sedimentisphaerales bacterium]|nr:transposase [Sedimentisphaerales bacterium]
MARPLRIEYPGAFYHVFNRGQRQEPIVQDVRDRQRFVSDLGRMAELFGAIVHSYCLMTNHYHLMLETPAANLSRAVQWLNVTYATYHNRRHQCVGHLFQGRFKAILVDADTCLEPLSRYIHLNPVRTGLASYAWDFQWSSCRCFVQPVKAPPWLELNRVLAGFGRSREVAQQRYAAYLMDGDMPDPFDEAVAGSLMGSQTFVQWVKSTFLSKRQTDDEIPDLKKLKTTVPIDTIIHEVADRLRSSPEQILAPRGKQNHTRDVAIYLSRELTGLSCRELGAHFGGISGAAINMRHKAVLRRLRDDRRLARDIKYVRRRVAQT